MLAVIIVDMQRAFDVPPRLIRDIEKYSRRFKLRVFTRFVNPPRSVFRRKLKYRSCAPGSKDLELLIPPRKGELVLDKPSYGLSDASIRRLRRLKITRAVVCGIETDACVLGVMYSLFDAGITCRVNPKLCWSSTGLHDAGLKIIEMQFPQGYWKFCR